MSDQRCRHCGDRVVRRDFLGREAYVHQPAGASFMDGQHEHCKLTSAWPTEGAAPELTDATEED